MIDKNNLKIPVFFQTGKEVSVYSWQEKNYEWKYPSAIYCQNYTEYIIPQAPERPFNSIPKYTSSRDLFLNVSTGDVFSKYSKPKKYTVYFELITGKEGETTQKYCITKDSFEITIIDTNVINLDQYIQKISPSICKNKGEISIDTTQFPFSFASFLLQKGTQQTIVMVYM